MQGTVTISLSDYKLMSEYGEALKDAGREMENILETLYGTTIEDARKKLSDLQTDRQRNSIRRAIMEGKF